MAVLNCSQSRCQDKAALYARNDVHLFARAAAHGRMVLRQIKHIYEYSRSPNRCRQACLNLVILMTALVHARHQGSVAQTSLSRYTADCFGQGPTLRLCCTPCPRASSHCNIRVHRFDMHFQYESGSGCWTLCFQTVRLIRNQFWTGRMSAQQGCIEVCSGY